MAELIFMTDLNTITVDLTGKTPEEVMEEIENA